jgi:hypothetical protein
LPVDRISGRRKPPNRLLLLLFAHLAGFVKPPPKLAITKVESVGKQMDIDQPPGWLVFNRELHAGNHLHTVTLQTSEVVNAGKRVVVGQRNRREAGSSVRDHNVGWCQLPITEDRVQVQVGPAVGMLSQW